jgi:LysM repeat protein
MTECSACGAELENHQTRCPFCGKPTVHYHRQRRCLHCGTPAAEKAETCMMCGRPVDSLPLRASFGGTWLGVLLGVAIIVGLVVWVNNYQPLYEESVQAAQATSTPTLTFTAPKATQTPTPTVTPTSPVVETVTPTPTPRTHVVEAGQSLYYIARQYQVSVEEIAALNNIADERSLQVGQVLIVPDSPINWNAQPSNELPPQVIHVIQAGETISGLSYEYDTPIDAIVAANPDVNLDLIYEGQEIVIPLSMPTATPTFTPPPTPTSTPTAQYVLPDLLTPADGAVVSGPVLLFNWTATGWLADDEFYVLQLFWPDGSFSEYWTKGNSWRVTAEDHPATGSVEWRVVLMRQTGRTPEGNLVGESLATSDEVRMFEWVNAN